MKPAESPNYALVHLLITTLKDLRHATAASAGLANLSALADELRHRAIRPNVCLTIAAKTLAAGNSDDVSLATLAAMTK